MEAYRYIVKIRIQRALAYGFDVFYTIGFQVLVMFATSFFWKSLYSNKDMVGGVTKEDMLTYTIISAIMGAIMSAGVEDRIIKSVEKGTVAMDMLKPVNLFGIYLAEDIGNTIVCIVQNIIPLLIVACIFIQVPTPAGIGYFLLFLLSLFLGYIINWLFAAIFGMWAFTAINMHPMVEVKKHIIRLLSGSIIPIWFFPHWLQVILKVLPFSYIYQLPLSLYIGKASKLEMIQMFSVQIIWIAILFVLFFVMQSRTTKKVMVQGG